MELSPDLRITARPQVALLIAAALTATLLIAALPFGPGANISGLGTRPDAAADYGNLPISFEPNVGQAPNRYDFVARGQGFGMAVSALGATLSLGTKKAEDLVHLNLLGASRSALPRTHMPLAGKVNYFIGNDPAGWRSNVPTYGRVSYGYVFRGIDVTYYGTTAGSLEYDFTIAPGADPKDIRAQFSGAKDVALRHGDLVITTQHGEITQPAPVLYQTIDGRSIPVEGRFSLKGDVVGFKVGPYDHHHPLVIDPTLLYSTYLGGSGSEASQEIAIDAAGAAYVVGTAPTGFPTTLGAWDTSFNGSSDVLVTKLNATGSALIYSTYIGGSGTDQGNGIDVDSTGAAYVTGSTWSTDFPTTGAFDTSFNAGNTDVFVTKLDPAGGALAYSTFLGGSGDDGATSIAVDATGAAYVTGSTNVDDFPLTEGAADITFQGGNEAFVTKLNPSGSTLAYSTYLGGGDTELGSAIALKPATGEAFVTGATKSSNFPVTVSAFDTSYNGGNNDAFVTKLNTSGTALTYSTYLGGSDVGRDEGEGIAVDGAGAAYVIGATPSSDFPASLGAFDTTYNGGGGDAFVTKIDATGASLNYSTFLGGSEYEWGYDIDLETSGAVYVIGTIYSDATSNFPTTAGAIDTSFNGGSADAFFTEIDASGSSLTHSTFFGGTDWDEGFGIAVDTAGVVYITGNTYSPDFPTTPEAYDITWNTDYDVWVAKIGASSPSPSPTPSASVSPSPTPSASPSPSPSVTPSSSPSPVPSESPSPSPSPTPDPVTCGSEEVTIQVETADQITYGTPEVDVIVGTAGSDTIYGLDRADIICGMGGDDKLYGGGGVDGGKYGDRIYGGPGNDRLAGDGGGDPLRGGPGNDRIFGDHGDDKLFGNGGSDKLAGEEGKDSCNGGPGKDSGKACEKKKLIP